MAPPHGRLKVHRRSVRLSGTSTTVLSPRPDTCPRFATARVGDEWQVVTDADGAQLLARLSWAMAFQRHQQTVAVLDPGLLVPNPFDADPSSAVVLVNRELHDFDGAAAAALAGLLPFTTPPDGTVVLQTRGLDPAVRDPVAWAAREEQSAVGASLGWEVGEAGLLVGAASPAAWRAWAVGLAAPGRPPASGANRALPEAPAPDGVMVLEGLAGPVERAVALRQLLFPGRPGQALAEDERRQMWSIGRSRQVPPEGRTEAGPAAARPTRSDRISG